METQEKKFRLPKEFAEKWIAALRSGEYKKGTGQLRSGRKGKYEYCCLGVAGVLCRVPDDVLEVDGYFHNTKKKTMPQVPKELFGHDLSEKLVHLNDKKGKTFKSIAKWIEQNVELY